MTSLLLHAVRASTKYPDVRQTFHHTHMTDNMASTDTFTNVTLKEDDGIPGAKLNIEHLQEYSNTQLKRWLQCRGLKISGNRSELLERLTLASTCIRLYYNAVVLPVPDRTFNLISLCFKTNPKNTSCGQIYDTGL